MRKGFTLIEFIMAMVLIGIICGLCIPLFAEISKSWLFYSRRNELSRNAVIAMERIAREAREIKNSTAVTTATSSALAFTGIDNDTVRFDTSGTTLRCTVDGTVRDMADYVTAFSLTYYNATNGTISAPAVSPSATDIRRIKVDMTLTLGDQTLSAQSQITPRSVQ